MNAASFVHDYFVAERFQSLVFILVGAAAIAWAVVLLRRRSPLRGMAAPLIAVALIQLVVGGTVYLRSDAQRAALQQQLRADPAAFKAAETPRMKAVIARFELYRSIELGLLALGMALVVLLRNREFGFAFGLGLVLQATFMLALDFFAERRAHEYFKAVLGA